MEEYTWKNIFENEREDQGINHVWSFSVDEHLQAQQGYLQYTQCTFARFKCSHCLRLWNSAQVHILFLIRWDRVSRHGTVKMKIFRQGCRRCNSSILEKPEITEENVKRVISNLVSKIQNMVYGQNNTNPPLKPVVYSDDLDGPHEKEHCEACKKQVCTRNAEKTMVVKPQPIKFQPWRSSGVQQDKDISWDKYTHVPSRPTTEVHQSPEENGVILLLIFFFIIAMLLFGATKQ
ncbi:receptor-transporting protein 3-like [Rhinoderma darwinii]|uniref:receptor-transporting protein 3-like n=1 Tax=Rhinoderma darwinii TaxID=43563 RepID=UPI003F66EDE1